MLVVLGEMGGKVSAGVLGGVGGGGGSIFLIRSRFGDGGGEEDKPLLGHGGASLNAGFF